ncbi:MAG TPA: RidA family protein [Candidatus Limnocylindrales bacterium]|nr:RidA family protein [Candidatus Limnocylindrales bacterium]
MTRIVDTDRAPRGTAAGPFPYSQAVVAGGLIFVSGQGPWDATGAVIGTTIEEQTRQALTNVRAILEAAGSSVEKIASVTFVLANADDFPGLNAEWKRWFPVNPPARSGAKHPAPAPGLRISIAAIAEA